MVLPFPPNVRQASDRHGDTLVRQIHDALTHLDDPSHLQRHPLTTWLPATPGKQDAAGKALSRFLVAGIEALRPNDDTASTSHAWRGYQVLRLRYVDGLPLATIYDRLGVSQSEYYRDHRRALAALGALLADEQRRRADEGEPSLLRLLSHGVGAATHDRADHPPRRLGRLPHPLTSFVGRDQDVAAVDALLRQARLVTLLGPPGVGKTRLAIQVARTAAARFADGVCFVALAEIETADAVPAAIAHALGLEGMLAESAGDSLRDLLSEQQLLLVLDNFEHVPEAARLVSDLLAVAPGLTVLATSRAVLRIYGEHEYVVPPLTMPPVLDPPRPAPPADTPMPSEAVRLFLERARAVKPGFTPAQDDHAAIAETCRRLDGLPLAIELAAARIRLLSPPALLERMAAKGGALPLLAGGAQTLPSRQRALVAAIRWSYDLLSPAEQAAFRRLAVFAGSISSEAALAVAACAPETLEGLLTQSLLQPEVRRDGAPTFRLLATLREFGLECLEAAGEGPATRRAFLDYYLERADRLRAEQPEPGQRSWLDQVEDDYANFRQALQQTVDASDAGRALRLVNALHVFWNDRGGRAEGRDWLERVLALPGSAPTAERATALTVQAGLAFLSSDPRAKGYAQAALALARQSGDPVVIGGALLRLGTASIGEGITDDTEVAATFEEALALFRAIGHRDGIAWALYWQGRLALEHRGDAALAGTLMEQCIALDREAGPLRAGGGAYVVAARGAWQRGETGLAVRYRDEALARAAGSPQNLFYTFLSFALAAYQQGDYAAAREGFTRGLEQQQILGSRGGAETYRHLATAEALDGALDSARLHFCESMRRWQQVHHEQGMRWTLEGLAVLAARCGQLARAVRLAAAADTAPRPRRWQAAAQEQAVLDAARRAIGEEAAAIAQAEGQALSLQQAVAEALDEGTNRR